MSGPSRGRRRTRNAGVTQASLDRRSGGLVRWQGAPRRGGGWVLAALAAGLLAVALIAANTAGWLHWGSLLMLVPAAVLAVTFGAGVLALGRRALAWLAG